MNTKHWLGSLGAWLALLASGPLAIGQEREAAAPPAFPATLALLVGINEYGKTADGRGFETLDGAENDVARAQQLLIQQFRFAPESIVTLVGPAATHEAIVRTFHDHLIQKAGPDTRVVFWFSGHGARIPDASGRDPSARVAGESAWDDTLVAYDSRSVAADGSYDLADDELLTLLRAVPAADVVVVTDCCHSGGMLRGSGKGRVRDAGRGTAPLDRARVASIWPNGLAAPVEDGGIDADELRHVVHIAACAATEEAGELTLPFECKANCQHFGTCTYYLSLALASAGPEATWDEVVAWTYASAIGKGSHRSQRIHLVGDGRRRVMGGRGRTVPPGYSIEPRLGSSEVLLAAGAIHGIGKGASLDLVDFTETKLGTVVVQRVGEASSLASLLGSDPLPRVPMRARPTSFGDREPTFRVGLGKDVPPSLLEGIPYVGLAEPAQADVVLECADAELVLRHADGRRSQPFAATADGVTAVLLREHHRRVLWNSVATPGAFDVGIEVLPATEEDATRLRVPVAKRLRVDAGVARAISGVAGVAVYDSARGDENRANGSLVRVRAWNRTDQDLHMAIVSVAENGEIWVLYGKDESNVVAAGQEFTKCVWLVRSDQWASEEPMLDRYLVIATPKYADFRPFAAERPSLTRGGGDPSRLPPLLREALGGARTRGAFEPQGVPDWGVAFADLKLVTPEMFDRLGGR